MIIEKLTPKQQRFCEEYIIDLNATQAAIRAGYSEKCARVSAAKMLTKANIQEKIAELIEERSKRTDITADKVIEQLGNIAFNCTNVSAQLKALELLGKHFGLFDRKDSVHDDVIEVRIIDDI